MFCCPDLVHTQQSKSAPLLVESHSPCPFTPGPCLKSLSSSLGVSLSTGRGSKVSWSLLQVKTLSSPACLQSRGIPALTASLLPPLNSFQQLQCLGVQVTCCSKMSGCQQKQGITPAPNLRFISLGGKSTLHCLLWHEGPQHGAAFL